MFSEAHYACTVLVGHHQGGPGPTNTGNMKARSSGFGEAPWTTVLLPHQLTSVSLGYPSTACPASIIMKIKALFKGEELKPTHEMWDMAALTLITALQNCYLISYNHPVFEPHLWRNSLFLNTVLLIHTPPHPPFKWMEGKQCFDGNKSLNLWGFPPHPSPPSTHRLMSSQLLVSCVWMCEGAVARERQCWAQRESSLFTVQNQRAPVAACYTQGINQGYLIIHHLSSPFAGTQYASPTNSKRALTAVRFLRKGPKRTVWKAEYSRDKNRTWIILFKPTDVPSFLSLFWLS